MSSSAAGPLAHAIGSILADRYRLLRPLGSGGMGEVFLAEHIGLGHRVAVKILHESTGLPNATRRFLQEARQTARLEHPNIVDVVDLGETDDGRPFLVMEYLQGEDLGAVLEREGSLPWLTVREILIQLCEGLEAAHQAGLVHRDLKPENCFLVSRSGREDIVKILDFGIAKSFKEDKRRLTRSGGILGTPEYMSPEQARGRGVDPRSDVYAVGVLAYEMLCGTVPFSGDDYMGVLLQHINDSIPPLPDAVASSEARAIVMRALSKDPGDRFESARAMAIALRASPEGGAVHSHPEIHDDTSWPESTPATTIESSFVGDASRGRTLEEPPLESPRRSPGTWLLVGLLAAGIGAAIALLPGSTDSKKGVGEPAAPPRVIHAETPIEDPAEEPPTSNDANAPPSEADDEPAEPVVTDDEKSRPRGASSGGPSQREIQVSLRRVKPLTAACIGGLTGGKPGDHIRVRLTVAGRTGKVTAARAVGRHADSVVGRCVADAARNARFPTFAKKSTHVTHVFEL